MKIYVASSWRNVYYPFVVSALRTADHDVYDFRNPPVHPDSEGGEQGVKWEYVAPNYMDWTPKEYKERLHHPKAERQFKNDIYDRMKRDFIALTKQIDWWTTNIGAFAINEVKIASPTKLTKRLPIDNTIAVKSWMERRQFEMFRFDTSDAQALDRFYAEKFLPKLHASLKYMESVSRYFDEEHDIPRNYTLKDKTRGLNFYRGYNNILPDYSYETLQVYGILYDAALHTYSDKYEENRLCHFQMDAPTTSDPYVHFYFSLSHKYLAKDQRFQMNCLPEELPDRFPPFWDMFQSDAQEAAKEVAHRINHLIWLINNKI